MKKIIILFIFSFFITSCGFINNNIGEEKYKGVKMKKENIIKNKNILIKIPENDIRNKTQYPVNFTGTQSMYFKDNKNIGLLLSYIGNMEYQGYVEKKEKEYAKIIVVMGEEFIKQSNKNKELKEYDKTILLSRLFKIIGNNYEILGENKKAIESYEESIKKNLNNYKAYLSLLELYKKIGEKDKVKELFQKVQKNIVENNIIEKININFEKFENNYGGYIDLGIIYKILGENKKSQENFNKAKYIIINNIKVNKYEDNKRLFNFNKNN